MRLPWIIAVVLAVAVGFMASQIWFSDSDSDLPTMAAEDTGGDVEGSGEYEECTVYRRGSDVAVTLQGISAQAGCDLLIERWSDSSSFWSYSGEQSDLAANVCVLEHADSGTVMMVTDSGSQFFGEDVCGRMVATGTWSEVPAGE